MLKKLLNKNQTRKEGRKTMKRIAVMMLCAATFVSVFGMMPGTKVYALESLTVETEEKEKSIFKTLAETMSGVSKAIEKSLAENGISELVAVKEDKPYFQRVADSTSIVATVVENFINETEAFKDVKVVKDKTAFKVASEKMKSLASNK